MEESIPVRYAFVMMLAIADESGVVIGTDIAIARRINMPLKDFKEAIEVLSAPDPESNNLDHDGRRVIRSDGERGYQVVSYVKYRGMKSEEDRRGYMREYMRNYRNENVNVNKSLHEFTKSNPASASASASVSAPEGGVGETNPPKVAPRPTLEEMKLHAAKIGLPEQEAERCFHYYESNGWKVGKNPMRSWRSAMINWRTHWQEGNHGSYNRTEKREINSRNNGTCPPAIDYGEAARRKLLRQANEECGQPMEGKVAEKQAGYGKIPP